MSKRLELFLIETEFHVDELSQKFKNQMIKEYLACRRIPIFTGYNAEFYHKDYTPIIAEKFLQVVHEYFDVGELLKPIKTWAYVQNKDRFDSVWHHHITTSSVNAVFYIDPPQKGGELELCIRGGEYFKINPKPTTLYIYHF